MSTTVQVRARRIVDLAAQKTVIPEARVWLHDDARGFFEKMAAHLLEVSAAKAIELGLTEEQVDDATAGELIIAACEALIANRTKTKTKRSRP